MITHRYRRGPLNAIAILLLASCPLSAADPLVSRLQPVGAQRGTELTLLILGQRLEDPQQLHAYGPGIEVLSLQSKPLENGEHRRVEAKLRIAGDARLGPHYLRLRTSSGWGQLRRFYVGERPVVGEIDNEKQTNNDFAAPQKVPFNSTVHGRIEKEDVDYFAVDVTKGQRLTAEVEGIRLGQALVDAYVAILDTRRFELAASDDTALLKQDPFVSIIAPADGTYIVMIRDSAYGGGGHDYRLHIGDSPRPTGVYPPGGQAGQSLKLRMIGDPAGDFEQEVKLPDAPDEGFELWPVHEGKTAAAPFPFRVSPFPNVLEAEPNDRHAQATATELPLPLAFNGVIEKPGDEDCFGFTASKDVEYTYRVFARSLGSPLDPVIWVYDAEGKQIQQSDDANEKPDSALKFRVPADGRYVLRVRDHLRAGGPDYTYRVEIEAEPASIVLAVPNVQQNDTQSRQFAAVPAGNRWVSLVRINRRNFGGPVRFEAVDLPPGVTMHAPDAPAGANDWPIVFEAAPDAALAGSLATIKARHAENESIRGAFEQRINWVLGQPNNTPYFSTAVPYYGVAVTEAAPFKVRIEAPATPVLRDGQLPLRIIAERAEGFTEPIKVQLPFRPPGVNATNEIVIEKDKSEAVYSIQAAGNAAEGDWPLVVMAFAPVGGGNVFVASPHQSVKVEPQFVTGGIDMAAAEQGQPAQVLVKLNHVRPFEGEARLELQGLPEGCATEPRQITKDTAEVVFTVTTTDKTPVSQHKSLFCVLTVPLNGSEARQSLAGGGTLRIDKPRPAAPEPKKDEPKAEAPKQEAPPKPLSRLEQLRLEAEQRAKSGAGN